MKKSVIRATGVVVVMSVGVTLAACSGGGTPAADGEPEELTFWGWAPGYAEAVDAFNESQAEIVVTYEEVAPGAKGGYEKMLNAVTAGNAPCLAQLGYETLTSFAAQGALEDVSSFVGDAESEFTPASWSSVTVGDAVYGAPLDQGPMALFYNKEVFDSLGIAAPATWAEYQAAGEKLKAAGHYLTGNYTSYDYAGLAWQAEAPWFSVDGDQWKVSIDSEASLKVGEYWQGLTDKGLISPAPPWDQSWFQGLGDGTIATHVGAVWMAAAIKGSAPDGAGKWAVAPMPQWNAGDAKVGNSGGSSTAVLKGCENPEAAWKFAHWLGTDPETYGDLIESASVYPAATALLDLPALHEGDEYYGGQKIFELFAEESPNVTTGWMWGPNMPATIAALDESLNKAWAGEMSFTDALVSTQDATIRLLEEQGLSVTE